eukprot:1598349-Prymnesium_polylepis.1
MSPPGAWTSLLGRGASGTKKGPEVATRPLPKRRGSRYAVHGLLCTGTVTGWCVQLRGWWWRGWR